MSASGLNDVSTIHTSGSNITTDAVRASTVYSVVIGHVRGGAGGTPRLGGAAEASGASVAVAVLISSAPPAGGSRAAAPG